MTQQEPQPDQDSQTEDQSSQKLAALEAVLFMAAEPLPAAELAEILEVTPGEADRLARQLEALYAGRGIQVTRVAGGYQVCTRPEYGPSVAKLHKPERFRLSRAALETLAIVAYKQPVTRPEVDAIRGVNSDSVLDTLAQYELIREAGRKEAPGRPLLYRTTDNFLGHFGLDSVDDLPRLDAIPVDQADVQANVPPSAPESAEVQPDSVSESAEAQSDRASAPVEAEPDSAPESTETREQSEE
jgi:segregation and condensation protein B